MNEIWVDILGYEGKYQVSNTGKVRSMNYNNTGLIRELKQKKNRYGYMEVKLSKNNKTKDYMVGRLVAIHFIPNTNYKEEVIHISKDATDNSVSNLKWAYHSESKHNMYNKGCRKIGKPTHSKITYEGKNYRNYTAIARKKGMNIKSFYNRMYLGWSLYEALEVPVGRRNNE
jgi:hypothetical protein